MPEFMAFAQANADLIEAVAKVRAEMGPEPSVEEGDELKAHFFNPSEGCDEFLITVESVTPCEDPRDAIITAKVRFTDAFWEEMKKG